MAKTSFFDILGDASGRLFHVDKDCFLIYAGTHLSEDRPYVRVGASDRIPDELQARISVLILQENIFQNLFKEVNALKVLIQKNARLKPSAPDQSPDYETLTVVGTAKQIELYKLALTAHPVPSEYFDFVVIDDKKGKTASAVLSFTTYENPEDRVDNEKTILSAQKEEVQEPVSVHYVGSNVELHVGKNKVFDIFQLREKPHTRLRRENELTGRYITKGEVRFYERGFILLSEHMLYYDRYQFFQSGLPENNFEEYMKADVNPDTLRIVHEAVATPDLEAFVKNREETRKKITLLTSETQPIAFIKNHTTGQYVHQAPVPEKYISLSDSRIHFESAAQAIVFEPPKDYPEIHYFYPLAEIHKKNLRAKLPWLPLFNPVLRQEGLVDAFPTELTGEISIIPREFFRPELKTNDKFVLVYDTRPKERTESGFEGSGSVYKIFPLIDYRFSKRFVIMSRLTYAIDLYLTQMVNIQRKVIREEYVRFVDLISKLVDEYVNKNINFRKFLLLLLNYTQAITTPRNKFEYFLLHNSVEFIRHLKDVLEKKGVPSLESVDKALGSLVAILNGTRGIEISDSRIKGNINRLPNGKKYLFYSLAYGNYPAGLSRQHDVILQTQLFSDRFLVNEDKRRRNELYAKFQTEVHDSAQLVKIKRDQDLQAREILEEIAYFEEEKRRLGDLETFVKRFQGFTEREKKHFYLLIKKHKGLLDPLAEEELVFDNLFEKFQFTKIRTGRVMSKAEKVARAQRGLAWAGLGIAALLALFIIFINLPFLTKVQGVGTFREKILAMPAAKKLYFVDPLLKAFGIDYAVYADADGQKPPITPETPVKFRPALRVYRSDVADVMNRVLIPNGTQKAKKIYDAKDLVRFGKIESLKLPSGQILTFRPGTSSEDIWLIVLEQLKADQTKDLAKLISLESKIKSVYDLVHPRDAKGKSIKPKAADLQNARLLKPEAIVSEIDAVLGNATSRYTVKLAKSIRKKIITIKKELDKKIQGAHHVTR